MKKSFLLILIVISSLCYSVSDHDIEMSKAILNSSVSPDENLIDEALEFDPNNQVAHFLKIMLMYERGDDLDLILDRFSYIKEYDEQMLATKLEIEYRLGKYKDISHNYNNYISLSDKKAQFYIIDSHIRNNLISVAKKVLTNQLYSNPYDLLYNELNYYLYKDTGSLRILRESSDAITSLFRLYGRSVSNGKEDTLIKRVLIWELNNREIEYKDIVYNYEVLNLIKTPDLEGVYKFDRDYNLFPDTRFVFLDNILISKDVDRDGDTIYDSTITYNGGNPKLITDREMSIVYSNYPYLKFSEIKGEVKSTYYDDMLAYRPPQILSNVTPDLSFINNKNSVENLEVYNKNMIKEFWEFKSDSTTVVSRELVNNLFTHKLLVKDNKIISGVRDLDVDGIFDVYEEYIGGELAGTLYLKDPSFKYYENYLPIGLKIISNENGLNSIILDSNESNIAVSIDSNGIELEAIVDFNKDEYIWWQ